MADTKKEHYVPQCYLQNFVDESKRIQVFDKVLLQERSQLTSEVAMENYFYDIDLLSLLKVANEEKAKTSIMQMLGVDDWNEIEPILSDKKYIEQKYLCPIESVYSQIIKDIIKKSCNGNTWVLQNCFAFSQDEKDLLSVFIALQIIRTKTFRETLCETIEKLYQVLPSKLQKNEETALPENIIVEANKDFVKLQHSAMLLNSETLLEFAEILNQHIWVMYVNQTDLPFYTSDTPILTIPHKFDKYISYGGFNSLGVEVIFPISPKLMIAMYEKKHHAYLLAPHERRYIPITDKSKIEAYNGIQVANSYRCVYSATNNFDIAKKICEENPRLRDTKNRVVVS